MLIHNNLFDINSCTLLPNTVINAMNINCIQNNVTNNGVSIYLYGDIKFDSNNKINQFDLHHC